MPSKDSAIYDEFRSVLRDKQASTSRRTHARAPAIDKSATNDAKNKRGEGRNKEVLCALIEEARNSYGIGA